MKLRDVIEALGAPDPPRETNWFALVLLENAAYLVDDKRRTATLERLERAIGITPEALLGAGAARIAEAIAGGGMKSMMRAEKVLACAELAMTIGVRELGRAIKDDPPRAKKLLRRFPSIGEPYADRILLFCGDVVSLAPDSNALRVLLRLGFGTESKNYAASYKSAVAAAGELPDAKDATILLRRHGQEVCKTKAPRCEMCVVRGDCDFYSNLMARSRVSTDER